MNINLEQHPNVKLSKNDSSSSKLPKEKIHKLENSEDEKNIKVEDKLELGKSEPTTGTAYKIDAQKISEMKRDFSLKTDAFKEMVRALLEKQGLSVPDVLKRLESGEEVLVEIDDETRANAAASIAEDGYFGVEQTSKRILDFAKALSGGDKSKIEQLKNAFEEGFEKAKEFFGGKLPEISQKTYDAVMAGFEEWEKE